MAGSSTVDPAEVEFYTRLADTWWDDSGPMWPLHRLNGLRRDYIVRAVAGRHGRDATATKPLRGLSLVDVGCGGGLLSEAMARTGATTLGIDATEQNIAVARLHAPGSMSLTYRATTAEALVDEGRRFDVVLSMEVVEHVADLPAFLDSCAALLAPGGTMVVSTINRTLKSWLFAIFGAEYVMRWLPRGTHRWNRFVKPDEISKQLRGHGIVETARTGVAVNPVTRHFSLTGSMAVNYMLVLDDQDSKATH